MIKQYNYLIVFITLSLLTACGGWDFGDEDADRIGISFDVSNNYPADIEGTKIVIGGINQEDIFIAVDTFNLPTIKLKSEIANSNDIGVDRQYINIIENRWNPDFDKIKTISDKAYFKAVLANGDNHLIEDSALEELSSINLVKHKVVKNLLGRVVLYIDKDLKFTGTISDIP
ncbi:hypothetical protein [Wenyingzhuangia marina]|uniref:Uncharacterized protein n=1 Tax=Wenyingzhuangia marina TaxID=1195760 RepID=A0A1M5SV11_9FLAO|nr:hypothetical protein [Wenyingzhuangia marina]GGF64158.1 hypothetical protein GCM10011397_03940 [Wenyingzhuangia marina]SHH42319.1 hypothetical protein SAMN05444281_0536 [Wenyingzhuangia marina]